MCPNHAIVEKDYPIGSIHIGKHNSVVVKSGVMNTGEESGVPIIRELLKELPCKTNVIDCPPGSACTVMESNNDEHTILTLVLVPVLQSKPHTSHQFHDINTWAAILVQAPRPQVQNDLGWHGSASYPC